MSTNLVKHSSAAVVEANRKAAKKYAPVSNFLKILASEGSEEAPDLTNAELLARKVWRKAMSDEKDSIYWATMLLERVEGKVNQTVKVDNPNAIVEQLYMKLAINGMSNNQIRNTLIGMGVDETLLPPAEIVDESATDQSS